MDDQNLNNNIPVAPSGDAGAPGSEPAQVSTPSGDVNAPVGDTSAPVGGANMAAESPSLITPTDANTVASGATPATPEVGKVPTQEDIDKIEDLTGEIQSLNSKIDKAQPSVPVADKPAETNIPVTTPEPTDKPEESTEPLISEGDKLNSTGAQKNVSEIYGNLGGQPEQKKDEQSKETVTPGAAKAVIDEGDSPSGLMLFAQVMILIGIMLLVVVVASPFFKDLIGSDLVDSLLPAGWVGSLAILFIGLVVSMFKRGQMMMKIVGGVMFVGFLLVYLAINDYAPWLGSIADTLKTVFKP